jgi:predicted SAM-dependent methyltransferase
MGKYATSETDKSRASLAPFCKGMGLDLGFGGDPILPTAIAVDLPKPYTKMDDFPQHLAGDARNLYWFKDGVLDYVFSAALLEDFPPSETIGIVKEWLRVLKPGGLLVMSLPDEPAVKAYCLAVGGQENGAHQNHDLTLDWFIQNIVPHVGPVTVVHTKTGVTYNFEIVLRKEA